MIERTLKSARPQSEHGEKALLASKAKVATSSAGVNSKKAKPGMNRAGKGLPAPAPKSTPSKSAASKVVASKTGSKNSVSSKSSVSSKGSVPKSIGSSKGVATPKSEVTKSEVPKPAVVAKPVAAKPIVAKPAEPTRPVSAAIPRPAPSRGGGRSHHAPSSTRAPMSSPSPFSRPLSPPGRPAPKQNPEFRDMEPRHELPPTPPPAPRAVEPVAPKPEPPRVPTEADARAAERTMVETPPRTEVQFKVGDKAVYPAQGVAEVVNIEERDIAGNRQRFYVLRILDTDRKIMVPVNNASAVGLRQVISEQEIREIFDILRERTIAFDNQTWNRRYRGFMDKIKTGSIYDVAEVLRDLYRLKTDKQLSFGERRMLDTARSLIVKEIAIARDQTEDQVKTEIEAIFLAN